MRSSGRAKVLIVDNDDRVLWEFQESLENAGFDTTATWSGQEALVLLKSGVFDVLLVDDYLPDLHSHDFLERVRQLSTHPSIVVMHDSAAQPSDLQCYDSLGVSELVDKRDPVKVCKAVSLCAEQPRKQIARLEHLSLSRDAQVGPKDAQAKFRAIPGSNAALREPMLPRANRQAPD
jgi:CheY-like chemotaxis protein